MTANSGRLAEVGPWAEEKLIALERYLNYYTTRLKNQPQWKTIYLDAFAGGGRAKVRAKPKPEALQPKLWAEEPDDPAQVAFVRGSPRRALEIANPFDSYIFIDSDPVRVAMLRELSQEFGDRRRIRVREGSADEQIAWTLSHKPNKRSHRGIAFLDPFGAHLEWASIEALAQTGVFEVIINFPLHMCLNRLMTKDPEIRENWRRQLDAFLPPGWYDQAYEISSDLLGEEYRKRDDALEALLTWYRSCLVTTFGFASEPRLIRNTRGGPLYYLLWAGPNPAGLAGANHIMSMGDRSSG